jgi:ribosome biogenesis GTPase
LSFEHATVVAGYGRECLVRTDRGALERARARSRRIHAVAGDRVTLAAPGVIEAVAPRASSFARSSAFRTKVMAANVTQLAVLVACEPSFSDELVCRLLVAAAHAGLPALLLLNKIDLEILAPAARARLAPFRDAGCALLELSAKRDVSPLHPLLAGHRTLLAGQSGMGKSTLVKALVPDAEVRIGEISRFLDAGRQSTTAARLYPLDEKTSIVDTPGVSEFGLAGLSARGIAAGFREFGAHAPHCRFADCRHLAEPGCAVRAATSTGAIHPRRLELYERIARAEHAS